VQISLNGLQSKHSFPNEFPYDAINPISAKKQTFNSIDDVYDLLVECYDRGREEGFKNLGKALYEQSLFFVDMDKMIDGKMQSYIKQYRFCKNFNCPPYQSLQETPIKTIDYFMIIDEEIEQFKAKGING
jgi:hypothetical protein